MDALVEEFKHLDFNRESRKLVREQHNAVVPYSMQKQEQNALIIYKKDGVVVPYKGLFDPTKKRRPRPKVNLDEETNRVWKLLLENINSEGIDGTDEDKVKWWEEERRVFRGRADSFIARMHLVQGTSIQCYSQVLSKGLFHKFLFKNVKVTHDISLHIVTWSSILT
jgi:hypothetical protein